LGEDYISLREQYLVVLEKSLWAHQEQDDRRGRRRGSIPQKEYNQNIADQ
jgi:hypothetical protein